jgi:betaine-aldehyde dehydrogenase
MHLRDRLYIGGDWVKPGGTGTIEVISPTSEEVVGRVPDGTAGDMDRAVTAARKSFDFGPWRWMPPAERASVLEKAADLLTERSDELVQLIIDENGSPWLFSNFAQVPGPIAYLRYYAQLARTYPFEEERTDGMGSSLILREPVGVVAAIVPWNVPMMVTMAKVAPALVAGCSVVLKPAPETPLDAYALAEVMAEAGLPDGVFNVVPAGRKVGEHLVASPHIDKVAFTGSTAAGKRIMSVCGQNVTRVTLELGGKSAAIVLDDAPLESTIGSLLLASFMMSGQICAAQTRVLVSKRRHEEFVDALCEAVGSMPVGDPHEQTTMIGPLVAARQRERVEGFIAAGKGEGATVAIGGGRPRSQARGWFVEPTVFDRVDSSMRIAQEEIFGPVVSIIQYDDPNDAVAIANDSNYGLSGAVWTADVDAGIDIARRVRTGTYSVNAAMQSSDAPFGGFKQSGIGRELGPEGLALYTETKSIGVPT